jgi:large subunit ribosomal protein L15
MRRSLHVLTIRSRADQIAQLNLDRLQHWIDTGRIDPGKPITPYEIYHSGLITNLKDGVKLLARGKEDLRSKVDIMVSRASLSAIEAIEAAGGKITTRYYTKDSMRRLINGQSVSSSTPLPVGKEHVQEVTEAFREMERRAGRRVYRLPDPTSRWDMEYYRDPAHRGYLSQQLTPGQSPSLFFTVPEDKIVIVEKQKKGGRTTAAVAAEKRDLW